MKKTLKGLSLILALSSISITINSCRNNEENMESINTFEAQNNLAKKISVFRSQQESATLLEFKKFIASENGNKIEKNAAFYHQLKLKSIYKEREEFKFISVQNLADELNSLALLDKKKSDELFQKYSNFLRKSIYNIEPIMTFEEALTTNIDKVNTSESNNINQKYIGVTTVKEGILLTNGSYTITWHVGVEKHRDDIGQTFYRNFTQIGSNVKINGQWIVYPSSMRPSLDANAEFFGASMYHKETLGFLSDYGSVIRNTGQQTNYQWTPKSARIGGTFTTTVNSTEYKLEGASNFTW